MTTIWASPGDVTKHIDHLWNLSFRELALDAGRDPSDSNVAIVKIVADLRLAEETARMRRCIFVTAVAAIISICVTVILAVL